ncbi:hypothetical protein CKAH01_01312 [Colletotrichum kahawae]|uniref:Uncharacterized protein n=1 Tax=Colletotrichum kahawae TaxID=34407 RepID=A0AAD9YCN3_COLKA|nr:hypothetical protein CKAH01_01312 [Colletotrichum kahawae]
MQRSTAVSEAGERARRPRLYTNALRLPRRHLWYRGSLRRALSASPLPTNKSTSWRVVSSAPAAIRAPSAGSGWRASCAETPSSRR